ncbi:hypothetical protein GCM10022254_55030 [Actinomadura meridiana]|uniref:XRE family transcriptional regulator n=1 Tax=Actinomadura meridiana TaxID=559626 RepID=A0ABP8CFB1_9ACTN
MGPDDAAPAPDDLADIPSFKAGLRRLKAWSGMSYRELERKAAAAGEPLPATTIADMLSATRPRMPREGQVRALVRACGCGEDEADAWVRARRRIVMTEAPLPDGRPSASEGGRDSAVSAPTAPHDPAEPVTVPPEGRRRGPAIIGSLAVCGIMLLVSAGAPRVAPALDGRVGFPAAHATAPGLPASGPYRIRAARSGLCLSERRRDTSGLVLLAPCERAFPPRSLERRAADRYRITTDHPEFGPGCMGIAKGRTIPGPYVFDDYCGETNAGAEDFLLTPVENPISGYTIRVVATGLCLGSPRDATREGAPLYQMACDNSVRQVFTVEAL